VELGEQVSCAVIGARHATEYNGWGRQPTRSGVGSNQRLLLVNLLKAGLRFAANRRQPV